MRRPLPRTARGETVDALLRELRLHTVCEEARCPNRSECYERGTATFLALGDTCTRGCRFCAVQRGIPLAPASDEPERVAEAAARLGLRHVVITMVTRDDLPDGGAAHIAAMVRAVRARSGAVVEVLTSDFGGSRGALDLVLASRPEIFNHNVETVPRLYARVRAGSDYRRSLGVLKGAAGFGPSTRIKSGLMLGLGEERGEVVAVLEELRAAGVALVTLGQYLSPGSGHLPVERFVEPAEFDEYASAARILGFEDVFAGPYVRSSYLADRALQRIEGESSRRPGARRSMPDREG